MDYQIIHASRGCKRRCPFCGVWKLEPDFIPEKSIKNKVNKNKLVFYDNNLLANPYIEDILKELADLRVNGRVVYCESQSGFDGRLLTLEIAKLLKKARFINPRIAWDGPFENWKEIEKQIKTLCDAGYNSKQISVFMVYNWDIPFEEMEQKRVKCWEWKVQIADCRYRPLEQEFDNYNGRLKQTNTDYYIHERTGWTDEKVKKFRKNVRRQNICIRHGFNFHSSKLERRDVSKSYYRELVKMPYYEVKQVLPDAWCPDTR